MKSTEPLLLTSALFDVEANKGSTISIMNKVLFSLYFRFSLEHAVQNMKYQITQCLLN